jgi:hypothetical protein
MSNILTLPTIQQETIGEYAHYLDIPTKQVQKIMDVLTVSPDNIDEHIKSDREFSPLSIKIGNRFTLRSYKGCIYRPIIFLQNELKRRYPKDYFRWINERESVFREQLYHLFSGDRFIKIGRNIELNSNNIRADLDTIIFDKKTKTLGIFQLKWQDKFSSNIKARKSRITNFYPKAHEWINKVINWINAIDTKELLSSLNVNESEVNNIYLFVLGRYNTHFSNHDVDERAAWGSWYHVVELMYKIKTNFDDPVRELFVKSKIDSPRNQIIYDDLNPDSIRFDKFLISFSYV